MNISSRTPEGEPNRCPICGAVTREEPSRPPGDALCPSCGSLLWFPIPGVEHPEDIPRGGIEPHGKLIPTGGDPISLVRPRLTLGRRQSCDVCLPYTNVSGLHCELVFEHGRWILRDRNSTNGVRVNGARVAEAVLQPGDTITIARRDYAIDYTPPADDD